jgi:hypothetical protein
MADVVTLGGQKLETAPTDATIAIQVEILEDVIKDIRAGKVRGLALVTWNEAQQCCARWATRKDRGLELAGAALWLLDEMKDARSFDLPRGDPLESDDPPEVPA